MELIAHLKKLHFDMAHPVHFDNIKSFFPTLALFLLLNEFLIHDVGEGRAGVAPVVDRDPPPPKLRSSSSLLSSLTQDFFFVFFLFPFLSRSKKHSSDFHFRSLPFPPFDRCLSSLSGWYLGDEERFVKHSLASPGSDNLEAMIVGWDLGARFFL